MRYVRRIVVALVVVACLGLLLRACPSVRDGVSGQLEQAQREGESAARTGVLAIQLWHDHRANSAVVAVQLGDANDQIVKADGDIAKLTPATEVDLERQRALMRTMAEAVATLNAASAMVMGVPTSGDVDREMARVVRDFADQGAP
jgi:uncharacterized protein with PhoU and TrkA domain